MLIHLCDRELERCREKNPKEIRDVYKRHPAGMPVNRRHCPNERRENENYIKGGQQVVLQAELNRRESEIENKIQNEGQKNKKRNSLFPKQVSRPAKRNSDNGIENRPHRSEDPSWRRPGGLYEVLVPIKSLHINFILLQMPTFFKKTTFPVKNQKQHR